MDTETWTNAVGKNGDKRHAQCRVATDLQFVKNAVSGKHNKKRCIRIYPAGQSGVYGVQQMWVPFYYCSYLLYFMPDSWETLWTSTITHIAIASVCLLFPSLSHCLLSGFWLLPWSFQRGSFSHRIKFILLLGPYGAKSSPTHLSRFSHFTLLPLEPSSFPVSALEGTLISASLSARLTPQLFMT